MPTTYAPAVAPNRYGDGHETAQLFQIGGPGRGRYAHLASWPTEHDGAPCLIEHATVLIGDDAARAAHVATLRAAPDLSIGDRVEWLGAVYELHPHPLRPHLERPHFERVADAVVAQ